MKKKKYLPLYLEWMKRGLIPKRGLCNVFSHYPYYSSDDDRTVMLFRLFSPLANDSALDIDSIGGGFWAYDGAAFASSDFDEAHEKACARRGIASDNAYYDFTPLRQTIVLFLAAMNNEL